MAKRSAPLAVRARALAERQGGVEKLTPTLMVKELGCTQRQAWGVMWRLKNHPTAGKSAVDVGKNHTNGFIHRESAVGKLLAPQYTREEKVFLAAAHYIGVARAEALVKEMRERLTQDLLKVEE